MVVLSDVVLDGLCGVPSGVVRDLGRDVMGDVGLADSVEDVLSDGSKELAVESAESTLGKGPLLGRVVGCEQGRAISLLSRCIPRTASGYSRNKGSVC